MGGEPVGVAIDHLVLGTALALLYFNLQNINIVGNPQRMIRKDPPKEGIIYL